MAVRHPFSPFPICPVLPARKNELYFAVYRFGPDRKLETVQKAASAGWDEFFQRVPGPVHLFGEIADELVKNCPDRERYYVSDPIKYPSASSVAKIAFEKGDAGEAIAEMAADLFLPAFPPVKRSRDDLHD